MLDLPEGGLIKRGGLFKNQVTRLYLVAFSSFIPYFVESTFNSMVQIHKFDTVFIANHTRINKQRCVAK